MGVWEGCTTEAVTGRAFEEAFSRQRKEEDPENRKAFNEEGTAFIHTLTRY